MRARDEVSFIRVLAVLRVASVPYSSRTSPGPSRGGSVVPHRRGGSDTLSSATPSAVLLQLLVPALSFAVRRKALSDRRASMHVHVHVLILPMIDSSTAPAVSTAASPAWRSVERGVRRM